MVNLLALGLTLPFALSLLRLTLPASLACLNCSQCSFWPHRNVPRLH